MYNREGTIIKADQLAKGDLYEGRHNWRFRVG